ncbi:261b9e22-de22-4335-8a77-c434bd1d6adc [Sclerotinia trifoliorum]|uniref:261b9e22-de22-4335-8a77-c434bd1d6adc n=1 Tax=Sclerotinia trifoliorum TaxID=28548 RepID=A0A8H2VYC8_9HELO|nr:261b9e22-de22-4335-8a77-c434bd1d6adc [Sclerotinia trifoliorum]
MSQTLPFNRPNGPGNKPAYIKNEVDQIIEISDSDSDDYEDAYDAPQLPTHPQRPELPNDPFRGRFAANNQMINFVDGNFDPPYASRIPGPAAAALLNQKSMNNLPNVKKEEPQIDWADWVDGNYEEEVNRALWEDYTILAKYNPSSNPNYSFAQSSDSDQPIQQTANNSPQPKMETKMECINAVVAVFPEICRDHVAGLYDSVTPSSDQLIAYILDKADAGSSYPKSKDTQKGLKRKRVLSEEEEAIQKYEAAGRVVGPTLFLERTLIRSILSFEFPQTSMAFIDSTLFSSGHRLFTAYRTLEEVHRTFDVANPPYNKIKNLRRMPLEYREERLEEAISGNLSPEKMEIFKELQACRNIRKSAESRRLAEREAQLAEEENERRAIVEGTMSECACCYCDYPLNRMVHCNSEEVLHWFCRGCARQTAETEIGNSKYELSCMSTDGCKAGFSLEQRNQFLDELTITALERNEAEAVLRMADIENLASCPFCPFAAEYPPVEINREFRCQAPDCEKVSCRLCKLESHIPMTCAENAKANGLSVRRQIEEAMSAAMIRNCNKCGTPFVKEEGCNKMTCTRNGCYNVQCYVCSKSCNYDHFNDIRRGGKQGNCPLFESVEDRHNNEVRQAEKEALEKVRAEHPEYTEDDLKIKMSENVTKDDEKRKAMNPRNPNAMLYRQAIADPWRFRMGQRQPLQAHAENNVNENDNGNGNGEGEGEGNADGYLGVNDEDFADLFGDRFFGFLGRDGGAGGGGEGGNRVRYQHDLYPFIFAEDPHHRPIYQGEWGGEGERERGRERERNSPRIRARNADPDEDERDHLQPERVPVEKNGEAGIGMGMRNMGLWDHFGEMNFLAERRLDGPAAVVDGAEKHGADGADGDVKMSGGIGPEHVRGRAGKQNEGQSLARRRPAQNAPELTQYRNIWSKRIRGNRQNQAFDDVAAQGRRHVEARGQAGRAHEMKGQGARQDLGDFNLLYDGFPHRFLEEERGQDRLEQRVAPAGLGNVVSAIPLSNGAWPLILPPMEPVLPPGLVLPRGVVPLQGVVPPQGLSSPQGLPAFQGLVPPPGVPLPRGVVLRQGLSSPQGLPAFQGLVPPPGVPLPRGIVLRQGVLSPQRLPSPLFLSR